ncbi:ras-GEF domain-containing family member 1A isoform X3 [Dasypus novemcinctus]|uniref:ras-GEF domain-containing family member 1A isoform X3 n=2 Tax=Dasypus novemcinctus TaxID=9361 RepID=UPI00265F877D|nr:ras-GEF domain-containing family member 1A isoform X2 [Dasypus novemcinctus]
MAGRAPRFSRSRPCRALSAPRAAHTARDLCPGPPAAPREGTRRPHGPLAVRPLPAPGLPAIPSHASPLSRRTHRASGPCTCRPRPGVLLTPGVARLPLLVLSVRGCSSPSTSPPSCWLCVPCRFSSSTAAAPKVGSVRPGLSRGSWRLCSSAGGSHHTLRAAGRLEEGRGTSDAHAFALLCQEAMPQTTVFSSVLAPSSSGQGLPGMGERGGGSGDLVFQDGRLISGSLEALMEHLVPTVDYYPDRTYIFTFLLSSRVFIPPHDLLARVGQMCLEQRQQLEAGAEKAKLKAFSAKIVQLLKEWTEAFPDDFQGEKAMAELKTITHRVTQYDEENGTVKRAIAQMTQNLLLSLAARSQLQELREKLRPPAGDKGPVLKAKPPAAHKDILGVCCDPLVLAQQLTHIELERISGVHPEDLMQVISHMDSPDNHRCRGELSKTYGLEAYDNWFNCLSMLVATEVCRVVKKKHRTRMVEFFIDVARECFNIGNFNSMMAIISGMNLSPVARLKKTWSKVKTAKFDVLEHHMDPSSNFCNYRTALQGATQRSQMAHSSREKIVIPVFNLFVKDIYFLHKIHTNRLPNGQVNFKKFWEISRQIHDFMTWTQVECPFEKDKKIQSYLLTAPIYSEEALFIASFESEGPENHMEKDSWKTLRTTLLNRA